MTTLEKIRAEICEERSKHNMSCSDCLDIIDKYAEQEQTGHWIIDKGSLDALYGEVCKCSECGWESIGESNYCSYCGAKMEREDNE